MTDAEIDREYDRAVTEMEKKVEAACMAAGHKSVLVDYSAYDCDENDIPIDNLDEVAVTGTVVFVGEKDEFWGGEKSKSYRSEPLVNPTWLQACVCANAMIRCTRDTHHCFFESVHHKSTEPDGTLVYELDMGS